MNASQATRINRQIEIANAAKRAEIVRRTERARRLAGIIRKGA